MVVSHIDGRLRIRNDAIKIPFVASAIEDILKGNRGIIEVSANQRVGSILINYDLAITDIKKIIRIITPYLNARENPDMAGQEAGSMGKRPFSGSGIRRRILSNIGMFVSLTITIISLMIGSKGLHGMAGLIFIALLGMHILN